MGEYFRPLTRYPAHREWTFSVPDIRLNSKRMNKNLPAVRLALALRSTLAIALMTLATVASAQIYECTNAKGGKEYAQHCPPGTVQQRQIVGGGDTSAPAAGGSAPPKSLDQQDVEFRKRLLERQEAEAKSAEEKTKMESAERSCIGARSMLKALQDGQRMSRLDPDTGERIQYGDEERAAETERQLKLVEQWCKK